MHRKVWTKKHIKYGPTYKKILFSFAATVLLIALLNGIITYAFVKIYHDQVRRDSQAMLEQIGNQMQQRVFQPASRMYVDLISNSVLYPELKGFFHDPNQKRSDESLRYYRLYSSLCAAVSSMPETFLEVAVYSKAADMVISSSGGVNWLEDTWSSTFSLDWTERILRQHRALYWEYTQEQISEETGKKTEDASIALYGTYPFNVPGEMCRGAFKIRLDIDAINRLFREYRTQQTSYYFIDRQGRPIVSVGNAVDFTELFRNTLDVVSRSERIETDDVDGVKAVIVSRPYQEDYILVSVTSLVAFYEQANNVRNIISLVELIVLLFGFLLAGFFSNRLYRPLLQLIEPAQKRFKNAMGERKELDEYAYIQAVMEDLSSRTSYLESVLDQNFSLIRDGFLQTLLYDPKPNQEEIEEKLEVLHLSFPHPLFCVVRLSIPQRIFKILKTEQKVLLLYGLLDRYHEYENNDITIVGTKSNERSLTLIVNLTGDAEEKRDDWMKEIGGICFDICQIHPELCVSTCVSDITELSGVYQQTALCEPYFYFLTDKIYLAVDRIPALNDKAETEKEIPSQLLKDFSKHLESCDAEMALADIAKLTEECKSGYYTARHCREQIFSAVTALAYFISYIPLGGDSSNGKIYTDFFGCPDMDRFQEWIGGLIHYYMRLREQNSTGQYSDILQSITEYIRQHLNESISLELLADTFQMSPNYLSRLFRERIGVNYTDYVNNARLELAAELLCSSTKKIDDIAGETGFNSSVYFIKRFKHKYGMTPKTYRMNAVMQKTGKVLKKTDER